MSDRALTAVQMGPRPPLLRTSSYRSFSPVKMNKVKITESELRQSHLIIRWVVLTAFFDEGVGSAGASCFFLLPKTITVLLCVANLWASVVI